MAIRVQYEGNNSIGVFTRLTNTYCLVPVGSTENYYRWVPGGRVVWRERERESYTRACVAWSIVGLFIG